MTKLKISHFKTHCVSILKALAAKRSPVVITLHGKSIAIVYPYSDKPAARRLGAQKGKMKVGGDIVRVNFENDWESLK